MGMVVKYADNILKNFANALSVIFTVIGAMPLFGQYPSFFFLFGVAGVLLSVFMYGKSTPSGFGAFDSCYRSMSTANLQLLLQSSSSGTFMHACLYQHIACTCISLFCVVTAVRQLAKFLALSERLSAIRLKFTQFPMYAVFFGLCDGRAVVLTVAAPLRCQHGDKYIQNLAMHSIMQGMSDHCTRLCWHCVDNDLRMGEARCSCSLVHALQPLACPSRLACCWSLPHDTPQCKRS